MEKIFHPKESRGDSIIPEKIKRQKTLYNDKMVNLSKEKTKTIYKHNIRSPRKRKQTLTEMKRETAQE